MTAVSQSDDATQSNRLHSGLRLVASALANTSLDVLAEAIDKDDTQTSRIRSGKAGIELQDAVKMLYAAGLKVVSSDRVCVARDRYEAMVTIASAAMACPETTKKLIWEGE